MDLVPVAREIGTLGDGRLKWSHPARTASHRPYPQLGSIPEKLPTYQWQKPRHALRRCSSPASMPPDSPKTLHHSAWRLGNSAASQRDISGCDQEESTVQRLSHVSVPLDAKRTLGAAAQGVEAGWGAGVANEDIGLERGKVLLHDLTITDHGLHGGGFIHQPKVGEHGPLRIMELLPLSETYPVNRDVRCAGQHEIKPPAFDDLLQRDRSASLPPSHCAGRPFRYQV